MALSRIFPWPFPNSCRNCWHKPERWLTRQHRWCAVSGSAMALQISFSGDSSFRWGTSTLCALTCYFLTSTGWAIVRINGHTWETYVFSIGVVRSTCTVGRKVVRWWLSGGDEHPLKKEVLIILELANDVEHGSSNYRSPMSRSCAKLFLDHHLQARA